MSRACFVLHFEFNLHHFLFVYFNFFYFIFWCFFMICLCIHWACQGVWVCSFRIFSSFKVHLPAVVYMQFILHLLLKLPICQISCSFKGFVSLFFEGNFLLYVMYCIYQVRNIIRTVFVSSSLFSGHGDPTRSWWFSTSLDKDSNSLLIS
jgi:hypothetical protein